MWQWVIKKNPVAATIPPSKLLQPCLSEFNGARLHSRSCDWAVTLQNEWQTHVLFLTHSAPYCAYTLAECICVILPFSAPKQLSLVYVVNNNNTLTDAIVAINSSRLWKKQHGVLNMTSPFKKWLNIFLVAVWKMTAIICRETRQPHGLIRTAHPKCLHVHKHSNRHISQLKH